MTFTYELGTPTDTTRVRFHTGDTDEATALWQDDEIAFVIAEEGTWQKAVLALIESALVRLAHEPDMTADWLRIDWRRSADNWKALLAEKRRRFGLGAAVVSGGQHAWRPDLQSDEPVYYDTSETPDD